MKRKLLALSISAIVYSNTAIAGPGTNLCNGLPSHAELESALKGSITPNVDTNGGFDLQMWGTIVANDGTVCAVAKTGDAINDQWLGSRVISAQKANTANAFSLPGLALSTANLFSAVQPGGSLYGLQHSNPVNTNVAYKGNSAKFGEPQDPLVGNKIGGVNVFGGGLALYDADGNMIGAVGVSGDTSCADHNVAWRTRDALGLDNVPGGVGVPGDNIIFDIVGGVSAAGFGHPECGPGVAGVNGTVVGDHPLGP